jgi:hypothetical protein
MAQVLGDPPMRARDLGVTGVLRARGRHEVLWASSPKARHSGNVAARLEIRVMIVDAGAAIGTGQGMYLIERRRGGRPEEGRGLEPDR